jgi:uncharacterized protein (TIGR03086 family)
MSSQQDTTRDSLKSAEGDPSPALAEALKLTGRLVAVVRPEQWAWPTPCPEWDVRQLVDHLVSGQQLFARVLRGEPVEEALTAVRAVPDRLGDDAAAAHDLSGRELVAAFAGPGVLERTVRVPFGTVPAAVALHLRITESLVHGWDLATALGEPFDPPAALVEPELAFSVPLLAQVPPERRVFAPSRSALEGARPIEHLVALLGRAPADV